jgi:hypothetical protein
MVEPAFDSSKFPDERDSLCKMPDPMLPGGNRSADPNGLSAASAALRNGLRDEALIVVIVGSMEYVTRA